jgi:hypothetical protein
MTTQKENVIREKRTNLAVSKNLMGPSGKFGVILQAFGSPTLRQGSGLVDVNFLQSPYDDYVYTEYSPTMSDQDGPIAYRDEILDQYDEALYNEGLHFDGLSRCMHIEIFYWHATNEIKVTYRGFQVYKEVAGELHSYAPFPDWEEMIEKLYRAAKERLKKSKVVHEVEVAEKVQAKKKQFWQMLRLKWGL